MRVVSSELKHFNKYSDAGEKERMREERNDPILKLLTYNVNIQPPQADCCDHNNYCFSFSRKLHFHTGLLDCFFMPSCRHCYRFSLVFIAVITLAAVWRQVLGGGHTCAAVSSWIRSSWDHWQPALPSLSPAHSISCSGVCQCTPAPLPDVITVNEAEPRVCACVCACWL